MSWWTRNRVVGGLVVGSLVLVVILVASICGAGHCSDGNLIDEFEDLLDPPSDVTDDDLQDSLDEIFAEHQTSQNSDQAPGLAGIRPARGESQKMQKTFSQHGINQKSRPEDAVLDDPSNDLLKLPEVLASRGKPQSCQQKGKVAFTATNNKKIKDQLCPWEDPKQKKPNCKASQKKSMDLSSELKIKREYRTLDGSCNYKLRPLVGMASTPFSRHPKVDITYEYCNTNSTRTAQNNEELPSARAISNKVFDIGEPTDKRFTALLMQMGQFIDHDIAHGPIENPVEKLGKASCCDLKPNTDRKYWVFPETSDKSVCLPIRVAADDPYWKDKKRTCINFARSKLSPSLDCRSGVREQRNDLSHWLDLSSVYGSSESQFKEMVDPENYAKLKVTKTSRPHGMLPRCIDEKGPHLPEICQDCNRMNPKPEVCFFAGDVRVNEQSGLTAMHNLWIKEHNRIADAMLSEYNIQNNKSKKAQAIFQDVRRIVIAQYQHIIWNEWLPIILGKKYMDKKLMNLRKSGYSSFWYRPSTFNGVRNEFATAAFRFGHSLIWKNVPQKKKDGTSPQKIPLHDNFFNQTHIVDDVEFLDNFFRGVLDEEVPAYDPSFTGDIRNKLFFEELDLTALNIQRGRDHGIAGYKKWKQACMWAPINNFKHLDKFFGGPQNGKIRRKKVEEIYKHVDDIDLFVGATLEKHGDNLEVDGILGPTFRCIIAKQFQRLKEGDRFWYENGSDKMTSFAESQLKKIREVSLAKIICKNTQIKTIQNKVFMMDNNKISCKDIKSMDLSVFVSATAKERRKFKSA